MLQSYTEFKQYVDSIEVKAQELRKSLEENQNAQGAARQEFADAFGKHDSTDPAIKKLKALKDVEGVLKDQLDIVESTNFHKSDLAKQVIDEYRESEKQVMATCNALWKQAEDVRAAAEQQVEQLSEQYNELQRHLFHDLNPQAQSVISHLDMSEDAKSSLNRQLSNSFFLTPIPDARKYYGQGHI
jgi:Mg2+ and Co2+ transporter CorA